MSRRLSTRRASLLSLFVAAALLLGGALFARPSGDGSGSPGADAALRRTLETPGEAGRENDLGNQLLIAGDPDGAEAAYRRAIAAAPDDARPRYNLGRLLLERGRRFSARRELLRALELEPGHAEARFSLGVVYDELGFDRLARRHYRRAFELEPALADPTLHPEVSRRRQALAALLEAWRREPEPSPETIAVATRTGSDANAAAERDATPPAAAAGETGGDRSGGYAHVTGGERSGRDAGAPGTAGGAGEISSSGSSTRKGSRKGRDTVIDPSDLRTGSSINQIVTPGESSRGGRRAPPRPTTPSSRGFGSRFQPPQRPIDRPFEPDEESTGRIEPFVVAPDDARFAIAG